MGRRSEWFQWKDYSVQLSQCHLIPVEAGQVSLSSFCAVVKSSVGVIGIFFRRIDLCTYVVVISEGGFSLVFV